MTQDDKEEWKKCHEATNKLLALLFEVTPGPRIGLITSMMLLITVAETLDATKEETLISLRSLWNLYEAQKDEMGPLQ